MTPLDSSNIDSVSHDGGTLLTVKFKSGNTYSYQNVSTAQHQALLKAKSPGTWVQENLVRKPVAHPASKHLPPKKLSAAKPLLPNRRHVLGMGRKS